LLQKFPEEQKNKETSDFAFEISKERAKND